MPEREVLAREEYFATPITLSGQVLSATGEPIPGVQLETQGLILDASDSGTFTLSTLLRQNALLTVSAPGFYSEVIPVQLAVAQDQGNVALNK